MASPSRSSGKPESYMRPPGPSPSPNAQEYAPPPGPPPSHQSYAQEYAQEYAPPPGPPPSHQDCKSEPPPYHDWSVIPDNSLLPPPPSLGHQKSPSSNADLSDADRAHAWCKANPLVRPHQPTTAQHAAVLNGDVRVQKPLDYTGHLLMPSTGFWKGSTRAGSKDACLLTSSPVYFAFADSPLCTGRSRTIYFELRLRALGSGRGADESSIAIGYCAIPYPTWRMPGWERASLAVHGDDGRRYVNNTWGGKDFTSPIQVGDTVGLGMAFTAINNHADDYKNHLETKKAINVEVFFTRNGRKGEAWDLHEELDADQDLGIDGLDGQFDLYAAVGTFGSVEFDVYFNRQDWLWRPR